MAFQELKRAITNLPVLVLPDFQQEFTVEMDASGVGIGAVLSQNKRPIAYLSQAISSQGRIKSVYERELLAFVRAVTKWKHYFIQPRICDKDRQEKSQALTRAEVSFNNSVKMGFQADRVEISH